MLKAKVLVQP